MMIDAPPPRADFPLDSKHFDGNVTYKTNDVALENGYDPGEQQVNIGVAHYFVQICSGGMGKLGTTNRLLRISALPTMVGSPFRQSATPAGRSSRVNMCVRRRRVPEKRNTH